MEREGVVFDLGCPYIPENGVVWGFPDNSRSKEFFSWIRSHRERVSEEVLNRLKRYFKVFEHKKSLDYPYLNEGVNPNFHLGDTCACFTIKEELGGYFISTHNLSSCLHHIFAFNIGADVLEMYDENILAPRIFCEKGEKIIRYPLPSGNKVLPVEKNEWFYRGEGLERIFSPVGLGKITKRTYGKDLQTISCEKGDILISEGVVEGRGFEGYAVCRATFPIAKIVDGISD
jgi:hypothetical protein